MDPAQLIDFLISIALLGVQLGVVVLFVVLIAMNWSRVIAHWQTGLILGGVIFVLTIPSSIIAVAVVKTPEAPSDPSLKGIYEVAFKVGLMLGVLLVMVKAGWHMLVWGLAEHFWRRLGQTAMWARPLLMDGDALTSRSSSDYADHLEDDIRWGHGPDKGVTLAMGLGFGLVLVVITELVFRLVGIRPSPQLIEMARMFDEQPLVVLMPVTVLAIVGIAIAEEFAFRGVLQPWLDRLLGGTQMATAIAIVMASMVWSVLHWQNTDMPLLKLTQIFLMGIGLGYLAKYRGVAAAITAHVTLNFISGSLSLIFPPG